METEREKIVPRKFIESFRQKIKPDCRTNELNTHYKQIDRMIRKIKENQNYEYEVLKEKPKIVINEELVNKLKLDNFMNEFKLDQLHKLDDFGKDILAEKMTRFNSEEFFYKKKIDRIKSKTIENRIDKHIAQYCDSINLIGHLARILPKPTDPPEQIWQKLLKPLNELENFNK